MSWPEGERSWSVIFALQLLLVAGARAEDPLILRRPLALAISPDERQLFIACRSGRVMCVDTTTDQIVWEIPVGKRLSDLAISQDGGRLFLTDEEAGELLLLQVAADEPVPIGRVSIGKYPVSILLSAHERAACIACLWSRQLVWVAIEGKQLTVTHRLDLNFAPRRLLRLADQKILVADAFGGIVAVIDEASHREVSRRQLDAHNMAGLCLAASGDSVRIAHQKLSPRESTTRDGVHWGGVMRNLVRNVPLTWLYGNGGGDNNEADEASPSGMFFLGFPDRATGDPGALIETKTRRQVLLLAGISEVGISDVGANYYQQFPVGKRPVAVALNRAETRAYVANMLGDSISVFDLEKPAMLREISLGTARPLTNEEQGEILFYDSRLSSDGWYSCHSCHTEGHTNNGLTDNSSDGTYGDAKRVPSLLGTAATGPWAWNGQFDSLPTQIRHSIESTMQGESPTEDQVAALAAFVNKLPPAPSISEARGIPLDTAVERGAALFRRSGCVDCHTGPTWTSPATYDVGLHDRLGVREFNPPSLRGVSQRDRLFHDGRAASLAEVVETYLHGLTVPLSTKDRLDLLEFLKSI